MLIKKLDQVGDILSLAETRKIKSGLVILKSGEEVGEHITDHREEVILVLAGQAVIQCQGERDVVVGPEELVYIPSEKKHNVRNDQVTDLKYLHLVSFLN